MPDRAITVPTGDVSASQQASRRIGDAVASPRCELSGLLRPDGSVVVPAAVAALVLRALVREVTDRVRTDGGEVSPACRALLSALYEAARGGPVADDGHDHEAPATIKTAGLATVAEVAEASGFPARTLRRWAADGRIAARRAGRVWLVDPTSLAEDR